MKYFAGEYNNFAIYYDTDLNKAFYLSKSYAKKHKNEIHGVNIKNHSVVFSTKENNKPYKITVMKAKLAGIKNSIITYHLDTGVKGLKFKINLILSLDVNCCYVLINGLRYPLAIEDFLNLSDKNYFMKSLGYFY